MGEGVAEHVARGTVTAASSLQTSKGTDLWHSQLMRDECGKVQYETNSHSSAHEGHWWAARSSPACAAGGAFWAQGGQGLAPLLAPARLIHKGPPPHLPTASALWAVASRVPAAQAQCRAPPAGQRAPGPVRLLQAPVLLALSPS